MNQIRNRMGAMTDIMIIEIVGDEDRTIPVPLEYIQQGLLHLSV